MKNQWTDMTFSVASLADRKPVSEDDDLVIVAAPDPQGTPLEVTCAMHGAPVRPVRLCIKLLVVAAAEPLAGSPQAATAESTALQYVAMLARQRPAGSSS